MTVSSMTWSPSGWSCPPTGDPSCRPRSTGVASCWPGHAAGHSAPGTCHQAHHSVRHRRVVTQQSCLAHQLCKGAATCLRIQPNRTGCMDSRGHGHTRVSFLTNNWAYRAFRGPKNLTEDQESSQERCMLSTSTWRLRTACLTGAGVPLLPPLVGTGALASSAAISTLPAGEAREDREASARRNGSSDTVLGARHSRRWIRILPRPAWHRRCLSCKSGHISGNQQACRPPYLTMGICSLMPKHRAAQSDLALFQATRP